MKKEKPVWKKILEWVLWILGAVAAVLVVFLIWDTVAEYKPDDVEPVEIKGEASESLAIDEELTVMTWNVGYCALGDNADFFMDGGSHVQTADEARVKANLNGIVEGIKEINPDIAMLQEVDINAKRSYGINQEEYIAKQFEDITTTFATNYKVPYIPYPWPPMGKVHAGIQTISKYPVTDSMRYQLPCPFSWPERLGNLKRCVMVDRIPLENSDKELVVMNLHLEAYDAGEGKLAQTRMLKEMLEKEKEAGNYVIAGGDFNQCFSNVDTEPYPTLEGRWHCGAIDVEDFDGWQMVMDEELPSCRSLDQPIKDADLENFQFYVIDGFVVSENIEIEDIETQDFGFVNTDHNPVVMKLLLK